jgi:hypothetical protein
MEHATHTPVLEYLEPLTGEWETEATHPALPDTVVRGRATFECLADGAFLIWRSHYDHPDLPDAIAILGCGAPAGADPSSDSAGDCLLHYFDSRGVTRVYGLAAEKGVWRFWRDRPGFSQRFACTVNADGDTMAGGGELSRDGTSWEPDLQVTYRRVGRG